LLILVMLASPAPSAVADEAKVSFRRDVMPILFRAGCNQGTCHGSSRGKDGGPIRLAWEPMDDGEVKGTKRAVAAGTYEMTGYRILRTDKQDRPWFISVTGLKETPFKVKRGKTKKLELDDSIRVTFSAKPRGEGLRFRMNFQGENKGGLTMYLEGKRIPIRYRIVDRKGKEIASGAMTYG